MTASIIQQVMLSRGESHRQMQSLPAEHTAEGRGHITHSCKSHPHSGCSAPSSIKAPFAGYEACSSSQSSLASRHRFHLKHKTRKKSTFLSPKEGCMQPCTLPISAALILTASWIMHSNALGIYPFIQESCPCFFEGAHSEQVLRSGDSNHASHLTPTKGVMKHKCQPGAHCTSSQRITNIFTNIRPHSMLTRSR